MKFKITHSTEYVFDSEVFLEPHHFRFRPKNTPYTDVETYSLEFLTSPTGHKVFNDEENNLIDFCWFEGMTTHLSFTAESVVETKSFNPFDFILQPDIYNHLPFEYTEQQQKILYSALVKQPLAKEIMVYGDALQAASGFNTIQYLTKLTHQLHEDFIVEYRELGEPLSPDKTFEIKRGSCRDLSWMQINLLRHQGFAARFVSGYYYFEMDNPSYELHAWVEVFLPGAGWLGLDPSHGILTGNSHLAIAASSYFENTMPVSGAIRGNASSKLITALSIEKL